MWKLLLDFMEYCYSFMWRYSISHSVNCAENILIWLSRCKWWNDIKTWSGFYLYFIMVEGRKICTWIFLIASDESDCAIHTQVWVSITSQKGQVIRWNKSGRGINSHRLTLTANMRPWTTQIMIITWIATPRPIVFYICFFSLSNQLLISYITDQCRS